MLSETYKNRVIEVTEETRDQEPCRHEKQCGEACSRRKRYLRVRVNGTAQFSYRHDTDPRFVLAETKRYIDGVDMASERNRQRFEAGAYVPTRDASFAESWRAAA